MKIEITPAEIAELAREWDGREPHYKCAPRITVAPDADPKLIAGCLLGILRSGSGIDHDIRRLARREARRAC